MGAEPPNRSIILLFLLSSLLPMASCSDFSISIFEVTSRSFYVQWSKVPGAMSYKISASPDILTGEPAFSVFDATTIIGSVNTLLPNTNYQVTVEAMNEYGAVLAQAQTSHLTAPEVPSIDQTYSKLSGSITVEWTDVPGATSYQVTAQDGESFFQTIVSSSPGTVTGLQGATTYTIRVRSINSAGKSQPSLPKMVKTVLGSVSVTVDSPASDAIIVSWQPVSAAVLYSVSLMRSDGLGNRWNENTTSTSINFTSLDPGTIYTIKLNAWDDQGIPGDDITFIHLTRPAAPSDVQMTFSNGGSDAIFSVIGADATTNYTVHLFTGNTSMNCSTVSASCTVYSLECGLEYAVYVEAINEAGSSLSSKSWNLKSVPCAPSAITVAIEEAGNLSVSWTTENLSEYYVVFVKSDDGLEVHCNTSQTHCYFPADCGFIYSMSVFAYNKAGQSPPGEVFTYTTAPCCPSDFSAEYKSSDTLEIVWSPVRGAELYETKADDGNNVILCNDTATLCTLSGLQCNTLFNVTVYSLSEYRGSNTSCASKYMKTAPCSPEITNITNINETTFTVYWNANNNDALYTVTAKGEDGFWDCTSANTYCSLGDLPCGSLYMVSVVAESIEGTSLPSYSMPLETAPCCPANLSVLQVTQSVTNISWSLSKGAKTYNSVLVSPKGEAKCHTLQNHCLLGCITCGTSYSVSIEAISETGLTSVCNYHGYSSSECCPFGVKLLYSSSNNGIRVSWRASSGPGNYSASLHGSKGNFTCTPSSNLSYCDVTEIPCGDVYTVVVSPITAGESQTLFCPKKMYSVACSGNSLGTVIYRGKRSIS